MPDKINQGEINYFTTTTIIIIIIIIITVFFLSWQLTIGSKNKNNNNVHISTMPCSRRLN